MPWGSCWAASGPQGRGAPHRAATSSRDGRLWGCALAAGQPEGSGLGQEPDQKNLTWRHNSCSSSCSLVQVAPGSTQQGCVAELGWGGAEQQGRGSCCTVLLAGTCSLQAAAEREETEAFLDLNVWMTRVLLAQAHLPPMNI